MYPNQNPWGSLPQFGQQQGQMQPQMQHPMGFGQMPPQMTPPIMQGMPGQQMPSGQMPMMGGPYAHQGHRPQQQHGMFGMPQSMIQRFSGMMEGRQMPQFNGGGFPFMNRQGG